MNGSRWNAARYTLTSRSHGLWPLALLMKPRPRPASAHPQRISRAATRFRQPGAIYLDQNIIPSTLLRLVLVDNDPLMRQIATKAVGAKGSQWSLELHSDYVSFLRSIGIGASRKVMR